VKLTTRQMAQFVADGCLLFEGIVPDDINEQFIEELGRRDVPQVVAGTPLATAFPSGSALHRFTTLPSVEGIIESLVGPGSVVDHQHVHRTVTTDVMAKYGFDGPAPSQQWHQDSTIDTRRAFDVQLMWYPHEVTPDMGGTRYLPGSHLRIVSEAAIARSQNILGQRHVACPAGTVLALHHGIWHGGGSNRTERRRIMYKIRLNPTVPQVRLWDTSDLDPDAFAPRAIFVNGELPDAEDLRTILCAPHPWYEADTSRLENINRVRMFRDLLGDDNFDVDYWLTRLERQPGRRVETASRV
jgi:hypothetical protein